MSLTSDAITKNTFSVIDMVLNAQRLSLQAMSIYRPFGTAFLEATRATERAARPAFFVERRGVNGETHNSNDERVIGVGEEVLNVGTRMSPGKQPAFAGSLSKPLSSRMSRCTPKLWL
jgi:hypothetical protein